MLRVHFTAEDLARTVFTAEPDPLWEVLFSRFRLQERCRPVGFRPWVRALRGRGDRAAAVRSGSRVLRVLAPLGPYFPDFLTPTAACHGLDAGLEALCGTPRRELRCQLERLAQRKALPGWVRPLADGDVGAVTKLAVILRAYHGAAIAPYGKLVGQSVAADHAHRMRAFMVGGLDGVFRSMQPLMRWRPPVLEIDYGIDRELHLGGRGLRFVPSYFCYRVPVSLADPELPPTLVYPISQEFRWWHATRPTSQHSVDALLGGTRSAVLRSVEHGSTTSQLARRLDTSVTSVSRHAAVLRNAGLITSHRHNQAVLHTLTPLGAAILENEHVPANTIVNGPNSSFAPERKASSE
jgi:DNA-binding transcriptional ArsR family regulator